MRILVTGASGFVGKSLLVALRDCGHKVTAASRAKVKQRGILYISSPELGPEADWSDALVDIDCVVHLAGLAHVTSGKSSPLIQQNFMSINADGSHALAKQCVLAGIKHFIFLSSCHAIAAESEELLTNRTTPRPVSAYGLSKLAAERAITKVLSDSGCALTILRPPLVYGPGNKANFSLLLKMVKIGFPLPLGSIRNRRSFIYVENLVDLIMTCLGNPRAFGKTFIPSDMEDVSTPELVCKILQVHKILEKGPADRALEKDRILKKNRWENTFYTRIFPFPENILKILGNLPGLGALCKLTSSLYVDSEPVFHNLGWRPPFTMEEGLRRTLIKIE